MHAQADKPTDPVLAVLEQARQKPWRAESRIMHGTPGTSVIMGNGRIVSEVWARNEMGIGGAIVHAVNTWAGAHAALRAIVDRGHRRCAALTGDESKPCDCGIGQARAALAAMEGKP